MKTRKYTSTLSILLLLIITVIITGCGNSKGDAEPDAKAVLEKTLNCTLQESGELDKRMSEMAAEAETGSEPGMVAIDGMDDYFKEKLGSCMTDGCIEQIIADRTAALGMKLAQQYSSDIAVEDLKLEKRSGEQDSFNFEANLISATDSTQVASAAGIITMTYDNKVWKASGLTMKIKNTSN